MTHSNPSRALPLLSDKETQSNAISEHLQGWSKNTNSRFGLKLYTFTPKKHVTPIKEQINLAEGSLNDGQNKEKVETKKQIDIATPPQKGSRKQKKRITETRTKEQSDSSSQYMPGKSSKTIKKRITKYEKQLKKAILF